MKGIEIPFGAKDSELCGWEYTIPEGMEAVVKDGKVIVRRKESEDERVRKAALEGIEYLEHKLGWDFIGDTDILNVKEYLERQKEQQPAEWSEEDELMRNACITFIKDEKFKGYERSYECIDWLKNLPERFNLPPRQEWSEEDEKVWQDIFDLCNRFGYDDACRKLKSLRPSKDCSECAKHLEGYISGRCDAENKLLEQFGALITPEDELHIKPRWKPSEEQMSYLLAVINDPNNIGAESCYMTIKSLYNDLKKLYL